MASYINIHGNNIPIRASDPSNPLLGEIWYNSTTNLLKGRLASGAAAWSSLANRNNGMDSNSGMGGTITDAVVFGGYQAPGNPAPIPAAPGVGYSAITEKWDGTAWTNTGAMNNGGSGVVSWGASSSDAIAANRYADRPGAVLYTNSTESFNGSTWTSLNNSNVNKEGAGGTGGPTSSGFSCGGNQPHGATNTAAASETWDGTCWTAGNAINTPTSRQGASGSQTAGVIAGGQAGYPTTKRNNVEEFDGTCWAAANALPGTRAGLSKTAQPQTNSVFFGGNDGTATPYSQNLNYDGTNWTTGPSMGRPNVAQCGTTGPSSLLAVGGAPYNTLTEQFLPAGTALTKTFSSS